MKVSPIKQLNMSINTHKIVGLLSQIETKQIVITKKRIFSQVLTIFLNFKLKHVNNNYYIAASHRLYIFSMWDK